MASLKLGTCALRGCDPKKVTVTVAECVDFYNRMLGKGVPGQHVNINWPEMMAFKKSFTDPAPVMRAQLFQEAGIEGFHGPARFARRNELSVDGEVLVGRNFVIASGSKPFDLPVPGAEHIITSDRFLELPDLPKRIVFIGGGFISFEFAHVSHQADSQAIIIDRGGRPLEHFDADLVRDMVKASEDYGIKVKTNRTLASVDKRAETFLVTVKTGNGTDETYEADLVVHGAGRVPQIQDLDLGATAVEAGRKGVKVNEYLQSVSNPTVYAAGDAAEPGPQLTPVAGYEGQIVADNIAGGNTRVYRPQAIPGIVYTLPPLGAVGLLEEEARAKGLDFRVNRQANGTWYNARRMQEHYGSYKIIIENKTDRILGAHIFAPAAEELINLFTLAIDKEATAEEMKNILFAYPTFSYDTRYML